MPWVAMDQEWTGPQGERGLPQEKEVMCLPASISRAHYLTTFSPWEILGLLHTVLVASSQY